MGDIDDLLGELNAIEKGNFSRKPSSSKPVPQQRPSGSTNARSNPAAGQGSLELDDLLNELDCIEPAGRRAAPSASSKGPPVPIKEKRTSDGGRGRAKCRMIMLGPPASDRGHYTGVGATVCCNQLRCTRCDLRVLSFCDAKWDSGADYMFFRNCYPDEGRLSENLRTQRGTTAYACQCQWTSCSEPTLVDFSSELRWVCAGH